MYKLFNMKFILILFLFISYYVTETPKPTKYNWKGKEVTYKEYRDSLRVQYIKYCDSLSNK